jgi:HPt (histidine-containing phosphotransfer) domain-containing protein
MNRPHLLPESILDVPGTLARLGGDAELFGDLIEFFLADAPELMGEIRGSVEAGDVAAARMKAHALKGLIAGCGGIRATQAAQLVEAAGQAGALNEIQPLVQTLSVELKSLQQKLIEYRGQLNAQSCADRNRPR